MLTLRLILIASYGMLFSAVLKASEIIWDVGHWVSYPFFYPEMPPYPVPYFVQLGFMSDIPVVLMYVAAGIVGLRFVHVLSLKKFEHRHVLQFDRLRVFGSIGVATICGSILSFVAYVFAYHDISEQLNHNGAKLAFHLMLRLSEPITILWFGAIALWVHKFVLIEIDQSTKAIEFER